VARDPRQRETVVQELKLFFSQQGLSCGPVTPSPILGPKGNQEFVILLQR
jgi:23S rRNA (cytidine1920-2'-O)/16S rRNA (cytidine1409-2'-O)-methyltransferase